MVAETVTADAPFYTTPSGLGRMILGDSCAGMQRDLGEKSVDLIMTSPPFALVRKKGYGNEDEGAYLDWFRPFAQEFHRVLKDSGSLVIDIGGSWIPGQPTRSLYHFKLLIMLCDEFGFHLAQEFYWWNPAKLPTPAEWVNVRRIRVKDAINTVWWLSTTPWPKASNRRVLQPYSDSMKHLLKNGYKAMKRPSGHDISTKFNTDNGAAIPPNLIALAHTESNSAYIRYCRERGIEPHPARYPTELPEYFMRMLSDPGDLVVDPFAGSCVTGEVGERLKRHWLCYETTKEYLEGALGRFVQVPPKAPPARADRRDAVPTLPAGLNQSNSYKVPRPDVLWDDDVTTGPALPQDGGRMRPTKPRTAEPLAP